MVVRGTGSGAMVAVAVGTWSGVPGVIVAEAGGTLAEVSTAVAVSNAGVGGSAGSSLTQAARKITAITTAVFIVMPPR